MTDLTRAPRPEIAKFIRQQLKAEFPECKFSVTVSVDHRKINVALMAGNFNPFEGSKTTNGYDINGHCQINHYIIRDNREKEERTTNGVKFTPRGWEVMKRADQIMNRFNFDNSDPQSDYFHVNYYTSLSVGKWDKPYKIVP